MLTDSVGLWVGVDQLSFEVTSPNGSVIIVITSIVLFLIAFRPDETTVDRTTVKLVTLQALWTSRKNRCTIAVTVYIFISVQSNFTINLFDLNSFRNLAFRIHFKIF